MYLQLIKSIAENGIIIESNDMSTLDKDPDAFTVKVMDGKTDKYASNVNTVFKVNGVDYQTTSTDGKGCASLNLSGLKAGTYTITTVVNDTHGNTLSKDNTVTIISTAPVIISTK